MVISGVNTVTYNGDGITTAWPYTFPVTDDSEISVQLNNADGTAVIIENDYYVDLVNSTVYYPGYAPGSEPPEADQPPKVQAGQTITVYREIPITQEADLGEKWPFEVIEKGLDKLTMIAQQIDSGTKRTIDNALASMELLADVVVDSGELQHITEQLNAIDDNAEAAADSAEDAADYAELAKDWATKTGETVDGEEYSAKKYAGDSAVSATSAATSATNAENLYNALIAQGGHPFQAATVADMTDTTKIYVYTGSETGYTFGDWYYYDGAAWVSGGVYNAVAFNTDPTLTISGAAADAKVTGDGLKPLLDVALTIPTPQNGYYTATIGETIVYNAQGVSRAYVIDCSAYVGDKVKVLYTTTATASVRATAMCDADGVVLSAYQEKNMSNDGFVLDVTDEYNQLYISFDTTYATESSLTVTVLNGAAVRVQQLQEDVAQIQAFDKEVAERLSFEEDISGVEVPILDNPFGLKLFDIGGGKYRVNKRYKDFYSEALEGIEWVSVYLNPETGNNSNDGSKEHPIKTIATALGFIGNNIRIVVPAGDYSAFNSGIQGQVSNVSKNIIIECEDGIFRQRYGVLCSTRAWTETGSGVWQNSIASSPANVVDGTTYYTKYSTLAECTANPQSYAHVSGVLYVHTADGTKPSAQFLEFSYPALVVNPQTNASVFAMNNVFLTDAVFDKGICNVQIKGDSTVTNYKSFTKNVKCNKLTFAGYSGHNYYGYNVQVDGSPTLAQDGYVISRNADVFLEKCYAKNCGADGFNYHNGVGTGTPLVVELECVGLNCGTELTATINNCSTLHENFRAIRIGGSYYNSRNRVVHDVNTSKSFNAFCYVRQLDRAGNTTMDFSVGADNGDTAEMMIYNCNTDGSRSTYNIGVHNGTGNSIKCYGTHFERVQTSEQINMDWNPFA